MGDAALEERLVRLEARLDEVERENSRLRAAKDVHEIQNVISRHEFYHSALLHEEELDAIWARDADDVSFEESLFQARFEGLDAIRSYYVDFMKNALFRSSLGIMRSLYPRLADHPETELPIGLAFMHTLTTPVIEVAADGESAKGAWVSPGFMTIPDRKKLGAYWHWDRYGVDFLKEDGQWKIWHFFVGRELTCPFEKSWVDTALADEDPHRAAVAFFQRWPGFEAPPRPPLNEFEPYSPFEVARLKPRLPEPYRTFSETFSY